MTDAINESTIDDDPRLARLMDWVRARRPGQAWRFSVASADASFRRYFRAIGDTEQWIVMDAPPAHEPIAPFMRVAELLARWEVPAPRVIDSHADGFLLLDDLGDTTMLARLDQAAAQNHLDQAMDLLIGLHRRAADDPDTAGLPAYDHDALMREMALMPQWYLDTHHGVTLSPAHAAMLDQQMVHIADVVASQPSGFVHRDYHSRNLMVRGDCISGMLDFQDAVYGPAVYDVVSLLRDCYVDWPASVQHVQLTRWAKAMAADGRWPDDADATRRWYDYTGLQRHLKVLGIFCRLHHRDGKPRYLDDLPRVRAYVDAVTSTYPELGPLADLLDDRVPVAG